MSVQSGFAPYEELKIFGIKSIESNHQEDHIIDKNDFSWAKIKTNTVFECTDIQHPKNSEE